MCIAAESSNILLNPFQRSQLIQQTIITGGMVGRLSRQFRVGKEAEHAYAVVDADKYNTFSGHGFTIVNRNRAAAADEPAAIDPDEHRSLLAAGMTWRPNIQIETILADRLLRYKEFLAPHA